MTKTKRTKDKAEAAPSGERRLFGTDGIRGVANVHPMTPETALQMGRAIAFVAQKGKSRQARVVIGKDTRLSGYMFETALAAGICAMGGRVMLTGPIPTPPVAQLTQSMRADAGVVISASHNPFQDNGIKIFGPDGFKLPDAEEAEIERLLESHELDEARVTGAHIGKAVKRRRRGGALRGVLQDDVPEPALPRRRCASSSTRRTARPTALAPAVFTELGGDVTPSAKPNGKNINRDAGALHPEHMATRSSRRRPTSASRSTATRTA
jgi:phosphoglucosamine mutase